MSAGIDTSVALRLLTGEPPEQAEVARRFIASSPSPVAISDLVVGETYFALRHHYATPHADAFRALGALLRDARIRSTGNAAAVLSTAAAKATTSPGLIDRLILAEYGRDHLSLATFDRRLARAAGVQSLA